MAASIGTAKSPCPCSDRRGACRAVTSPLPQPLWPKGPFWAHVSEVSRALCTAPRLSPALPCRSLLPLARCHPSPTGRAQTAGAYPKRLLKALLPSSKMADRASLCPAPLALIKDGRPPPFPSLQWAPGNLLPSSNMAAPTRGLAGLPDARAAMLSEAGAAAASRHAWRAAGRPEEGAGRLLTTWRPLAPPREEEAEGEAAAGGGRSLIHREPGSLPSPPPSPSSPPSPPPQRPPRPLPGTMSFFRRKGRGAAGGRPGAEGRLPTSSPARLLGPGPAPPGTATGPREEARPLRSGLPANDGQSRHLPAPAAGPFSSLGVRGRGRGGRGGAGIAAAGPRVSAAGCLPVGAPAATSGSPSGGR